MFEIQRYNNYNIDIKGDSFCLFVLTVEKDQNKISARNPRSSVSSLFLKAAFDNTLPDQQCREIHGNAIFMELDAVAREAGRMSSYIVF